MLERLPNELLNQMLTGLDKPDLGRVCLSCHRLRAVSEPVLYCSFEEDHGNAERVRLFLLTIIKRPDLALHCEGLELAHWEENRRHDRPNGLLANGEQMRPRNDDLVLAQAAIRAGLLDRRLSQYTRSGDTSVDPDGKRLLKGSFGHLWYTEGPSSFLVYANLLLTMLQRVKFAYLDWDWSDSHRILWGNRGGNDGDIVRNRGFSELRTLKFEGSSDYNCPERVHLGSCLYVPSLRTISCNEGLDVRIYLERPFIPLRLTHIQLVYCRTSVEQLEMLFNACEALTDFHYMFRTSDYYGSKHVAYGVIAALAKHQKSLKWLGVVVNRDYLLHRDQFLGVFPSYRSTRALPQFEALSCVQLDFCTLLNVDRKMHQMLPYELSIAPSSFACLFSHLS